MYLNDFILIENVAISMIAILIEFSSVSIVILNYINGLYLVFIVLYYHIFMINIYQLFITQVHDHNGNSFVYLTYISHIEKHCYYMLDEDK